MDLLAGIKRGDRLALARAITAVENRDEGRRELVRYAYRHARGTHIVGVTGPPGVGKSTLVDGLAACYRKQGHTVGIVAVDPTSPFTGGALLGDRVRMQRHGLDEGVFIRSLATRGSLGGLSRATGEVIRLMDAFGFDVIMVETVGAGQSEVDIMRFAGTVVLTMAPGLGDDIQSIKAGIMEIADVFCINKADRDGVDRTITEIRMMLDLRPTQGWRPPIIKAVASRDEGLEELKEEVVKHQAYLKSSGDLAARQLDTFRAEVEEILKDRLVNAVMRQAKAELADAFDRVRSGELDPIDVAERLMAEYIDR